MALVVALILALLAFVVWRAQSRRRRSVSGKAPAKSNSSRQSHPYSAVRVEAVGVACSAVEQEAGKVWLSAEAPELPLEGCDQQACHCHYVYLEDRRQGDDRRNPYVPVDVSVYDEKKLERKGRGRRSDD